MPNLGNRERIIAVAEELFQERGFAHVTIKDICQQVGCSKGIFHYHFGSMNGLLLEFLKYHSIVTPTALAQAVMEPTAWGKLWKICKLYFERFPELGVDAISSLSGWYTPERRQLMEKNRSILIELIAPIIQQGQQTGEFGNPSLPEELSMTIIITAYGVDHLWLTCNGEIDHEKSLEAQLRLLLLVK